MKLSKQFMQTNLKSGYLYWQPISLNHPQQGTDGPTLGSPAKKRKPGGATAPGAAILRGARPPGCVPVTACCLASGAAVTLRTCETDPAFLESSLLTGHLPTVRDSSLVEGAEQEVASACACGAGEIVRTNWATGAPASCPQLFLFLGALSLFVGASLSQMAGPGLTSALCQLRGR